MAFLSVGKENDSDILLYYEDRGQGKPVVLVHGWPLNGASWERQTAALLAAGYRVITYDRRGFGMSSKPSGGYNYDTLAGDLAKLIDALQLKDVALAGMSMGGGEVARYMGKYNQGAVTKVIFVSSIVPALRKDGNNPEGVDPKVFDDLKENIVKDRFAFLQDFGKKFYNHGLLSSAHSSDALLQANFNVAASSYYNAMLFCVDAWLEDFRDDVLSIKVPTLVVHGDADKIVPLEVSGKRTAEMVPNAELKVIDGGPHGCIWTHAAEVNMALLNFLKNGTI